MSWNSWYSDVRPDDILRQLESQQRSVAHGIVIEVRVTGDGRELQIVVDVPLQVGVCLPVLVVVVELAGRIPVRIEIVDEAERRHGVVVEYYARIVEHRQRRLARQHQRVGQPVGIVALHVVRSQVEADDVLRRAGALGVAVQSADGQLDVVGESVGDLDACQCGLGAAQLLRGALDVAVLVEVGGLRADRQLVADRHVDHGADVLVVVAQRAAHIGVEFIRRLLREEADGAAFAVAAEQRALRTAQHLGALDVEHLEHRAAGARHIDAVDVQRDAALSRGSAAAADAADRKHRGVVAAGAATLDAEVGGEVGRAP